MGKKENRRRKLIIRNAQISKSSCSRALIKPPRYQGSLWFWSGNTYLPTGRLFLLSLRFRSLYHIIRQVWQIDVFLLAGSWKWPQSGVRQSVRQGPYFVYFWTVRELQLGLAALKVLEEKQRVKISFLRREASPLYETLKTSHRNDLCAVHNCTG
jgi:hypothetical protein